MVVLICGDTLQSWSLVSRRAPTIGRAGRGRAVLGAHLFHDQSEPVGARHGAAAGPAKTGCQLSLADVRPASEIGRRPRPASSIWARISAPRSRFLSGTGRRCFRCSNERLQGSPAPVDEFGRLNREGWALALTGLRSAFAALARALGVSATAWRRWAHSPRSRRRQRRQGRSPTKPRENLTAAGHGGHSTAPKGWKSCSANRGACRHSSAAGTASSAIPGGGSSVELVRVGRTSPERQAMAARDRPRDQPAAWPAAPCRAGHRQGQDRVRGRSTGRWRQRRRRGRGRGAEPPSGRGARVRSPGCTAGAPRITRAGRSRPPPARLRAARAKRCSSTSSGRLSRKPASNASTRFRRKLPRSGGLLAALILRWLIGTIASARGSSRPMGRARASAAGLDPGRPNGLPRPVDRRPYSSTAQTE